MGKQSDADYKGSRRPGRISIDHPKDFKGHSLSVSDVVVLHQSGQDTAHYVDSIGYKQVPEFLQEQTKQLMHEGQNSLLAPALPSAYLQYEYHHL